MRIAFRLPDPKAWMGGVNYLLNLARILRCYEPGLEPIIFAPEGLSDELIGNIVASTGRSPVSLPSRTKRDDAIDLLGGTEKKAVEAFRREHIDLIFESANYYGKKTGLPILSWIPDFQHCHLAHFFPGLRWWTRDIGYRLVLANRSDVMLSSQNAQDDARRFYPRINACLHVVPFAVRIAPQGAGASAAVRAKYDLPDRYFFLPNQLWVHKNHTVVIEALRLLRVQGERMPVIVATGTGSDPRSPNLLERLKGQIKDSEVEQYFRILGPIPYGDLLRLLEGAAALINPSLFEGWSTTVEEARALGTPMILSDLPVHREQMAQAALYFDPESAADCARALKTALIEGRPEAVAGATANERAERAYAERFHAAAKSAVDHYIAG